MHLLCIEHVPQLRPSPQLIRQKTMIEMVSDDLLGYGEQITAITTRVVEKHWKRLSFRVD